MNINDISLQSDQTIEVVSTGIKVTKDGISTFYDAFGNLVKVDEKEGDDATICDASGDLMNPAEKYNDYLYDALLDYKDCKSEDNKDVIFELLKHPENIHGKRYESYNGKTTIMIALKLSITEVVYEMLHYSDKCGLDVVDNDGNTFLMLAIKSGSNTMATAVLLLSDSSVVKIVNNNNETPLMMICANILYPAYFTLKKMFYEQLMLDAVNNDNKTAIICALNSFSRKRAKTRLTEVMCMDMLRDYDQCNLSTVSDNGHTALNLACHFKLKMITKTIISKIDQCALGVGDKLTNKTPLMHCCLNSWEDIALIMLDRPDLCGLGEHDSTGHTALMYACKYNHSEAALAMLKHTDLIDINKKSTDGKSAFTYAKQNNMEDVTSAILLASNDLSILGLDKATETIVRRIMEDSFKMRVEKLKDHEDITKGIELMNKRDKKIKESIDTRSCITCTEPTERNVFYTNCKHVIPICSECVDQVAVAKKCPVCSTKGTYVEGLYIL